MLLAALETDTDRLFFELLTHTGCRISEFVALNWEHVDLGSRPHVKVSEQFYRGTRKRLKTGAGKRTLPLSPAMRDRLLARRRAAYGGEGAPIFPSRGSRTRPDGLPYPVSPQNHGRDVLRPAREAVGLGWATYHTFRHTCASLLFDQGKSIRQVAEWLGHTDPSFTLRQYVHLMDDGLGDVAFLDEIVKPAGPPKSNAGATRATGTPGNQESGQDAKVTD